MRRLALSLHLFCNRVALLATMYLFTGMVSVTLSYMSDALDKLEEAIDAVLSHCERVQKRYEELSYRTDGIARDHRALTARMARAQSAVDAITDELTAYIRTQQMKSAENIGSAASQSDSTHD